MRLYYIITFQRLSSKMTDWKIKEKALFRMGRSAYLRRDFYGAFHHFANCFELNNSNQDAELSLQNCRMRLQEMVEGSYNWSEIIKQYENGHFQLDMADFQSHKITIKDIEENSKVYLYHILSYIIYTVAIRDGKLKN